MKLLNKVTQGPFSGEGVAQVSTQRSTARCTVHDQPTLRHTARLRGPLWLKEEQASDSKELAVFSGREAGSYMGPGAMNKHAEMLDVCSSNDNDE